MGKSNGHKWFKTGQKKGVKNFTFERALFRVHVKKIEELPLQVYSMVYKVVSYKKFMKIRMQVKSEE